jgi:hypothetical protein
LTLVSDLGPAVIHARALILNEPLNRRFINQFVDLVLIPALHAAASSTPEGRR